VVQGKPAWTDTPKPGIWEVDLSNMECPATVEAWEKARASNGTTGTEWWEQHSCAIYWASGMNMTIASS
jgi:hypothetical protein